MRSIGESNVPEVALSKLSSSRMFSNGSPYATVMLLMKNFFRFFDSKRI